MFGADFLLSALHFIHRNDPNLTELSLRYMYIFDLTAILPSRDCVSHFTDESTKAQRG